MKTFHAIALVAALTTSFLAGCSVYNSPQKPTQKPLETLPVVPMATIEDCDIIISQRVYKQTDFLVVERDKNFFSSTLLDGKELTFELPSMRNANGIQEMIGRFFWTRNACLNEAIQHIPNHKSSPDLISTRVEKK